MYPKSKSIYIVLLVLLSVSPSCKKQNTDSESRTELLSSGPWIMTAVTFHGDWDSDGVTDPVDKDLFPLTGTCSKDNLLIFNANGSGSYNEGSDVCRDAQQSITFSWSFHEPFTDTYNENIIKLWGLGLNALIIIVLNTTTLKVKNIVSNGEQIFTYKH